ncbi:hypothetical protein TNCV_1423281 [Trichonephila clavipes]|nr:hypothetical protein TNCV_1423281 [Trichonephila clavipes]
MNWSGNEQQRKTPAGLDCPTVHSEEFLTGKNYNVCTALIMKDKNILVFVQSSKYILDADSNDEIKINKAASVATSSEMRNIMKSMHRYLDAHSN